MPVKNLFVKDIYLMITTAFANKRKSLKPFAAACIFLAGMMPLKSLAQTSFPMQAWTSVTIDKPCTESLVTYTLIFRIGNGSGIAVVGGAIGTITFPAGFTFTSISAVEFNGTDCQNYTTTATTINFQVPGITGTITGAANSADTIIIAGVINTSTVNSYQLSMTIPNKSGGTNTWPMSANSQFDILLSSIAPDNGTVDVNNFCSATSGNILLTASGGRLGIPGAVVAWYTGNCGGLSGGTLVGTGNPISLPKPTTTTTYFVRYEGCNNTSCFRDKVTVLTSPVISPVTTFNVCPGSTIQLKGSGGGGASTTPWNSLTTAVATVSPGNGERHFPGNKQNHLAGSQYLYRY
jgi:hypothetical protein